MKQKKSKDVRGAVEERLTEVEHVCAINVKRWARELGVAPNTIRWHFKRLRPELWARYEEFWRDFNGASR